MPLSGTTMVVVARVAHIGNKTFWIVTRHCLLVFRFLYGGRRGVEEQCRYLARVGDACPERLPQCRATA